MENRNKYWNNYYLGLDIGTDSVGYAVTDEQYNLLKFHGDSAWGVHVFDSASLNTERRKFRTSRRRLDRRQQRVALLQELFAKEIGKIDPRFFIRLQESDLYREDGRDCYTLFNDMGYTDREYYAQYPTIHHLICDLMENSEPHDARLVYLACAWLVAHRGHFLSHLDENNLSNIKNFDSVYHEFIKFFEDNGYSCPWEKDNITAIGDILRNRVGVTVNEKELCMAMLNQPKAPKNAKEDFPFGQDAIIKLLSGKKCKLKDLYCDDSLEDSVSLSMDDDKLSEISANIGEQLALISALRSIYDWSVLVDVLGEASTISEAKVNIYDQHKTDLAFLKSFIKAHCPEKYDEVFRALDKDNYAAYTHHTNYGDAIGTKTKKTIDDLSKFILSIVKSLSPNAEEQKQYDDMITRLELRTFLPKQRNTNNRVIPYQLYLYELRRILENAQVYLPFLTEPDEDGLTVSEKILSVFSFRVPYFVGPLNPASDNAWVVREPGKIYPWNFEQMVDLDASEQAFIQRMTNYCTYLPGEPVLPKDSLLYHRFMVLNEINNIQIKGERISTDLKQNIYNDLFLRMKKVTRKRLIEYLLSEGIIVRGEEETVTGIDIEINANLAPQIAFRKLLEAKTITTEDAERIIERSTYAEDKSRLEKWLSNEYRRISKEDRKYICTIKCKDFGRLSRRFLTELYGASKKTGEAYSIIDALWNTCCNLMELLSDQYTFAEQIEAIQREHYAAHPQSLTDRMDEMYLSNTVKRSVFRTLDVVKDVTKAFGTPKKIFVEMTRGAKEDQKGKRTLSRKQQLLDLYKKCTGEDVPYLRQQLEDMGDSANSRLQSNKLFLYYLQLGRSMYSGERIELEELGSKKYDIDHIYPQAYVKDDSIINNKVLVSSKENGDKGDIYPIKEEIRDKMKPYWTMLHDMGLMGDEKYKRLIRATPFTDEERLAFINRQLTETSQSTKAVATLLKEKFPDTEIVYCKAQLVSEFRQEFELPKSRLFNDLHHAVDAYLNIVTGNVYNMKFTKNFDVRSKYSIKTKTVFTNPDPVTSNGVTVWDSERMLDKVKETAIKNTAHFTKYSFFKTGGFFDQTLYSKAQGLVPRKKDLPTEKYGGYNKAGAMFLIPVRYTAGKKSELFIMSVELLHGNQFLQDSGYAASYAKERIGKILNKKIDSVTFPLGMRPWKINTMLSLDGFRVCISGTSSGGRCLVAQSAMQFSADKSWQSYLKLLENFTEKTSRNSNYVYDAVYDKVTKEKNMELYDLYCDKLENSIYKMRVNAPIETLKSGKSKFEGLSTIQEQSKALLNIHLVFGRAGTCNLTAIGGEKSAASPKINANVANWKKYYSDVRIIDMSASGLWETRSGNLLELL